MEDWHEKYKRQVISAEEAAQMVKSGDKVVFSAGRETFAIGMAIAARLGELKNVKIFVPSPGYDFGWYDAGWDESFDVTVMMGTATCQEAIDTRRCDFNFGTIVPFYMIEEMLNPDILLIEVSPPNEKGFCSFGQSLWNKRKHVAQAKLVVAEVNKNLIRTYGDNFVHVSEINYLVEHLTTGAEPGKGSLAGRVKKEPEPFLKDIAGYVSGLIKDKDTIQIGVGRTTEPLVQLGLFDNKHDLGYHSEATPPGVITLVKEGVINGKYKTLNPEKVVVTSLGGGTREEMEWASDNPLFWLVDVDYLEDMRVIAAHDNMVALNNVMAIDLTGQVAAEGLGTRQWSIAGGQIPFVIGSVISKGGRCIFVLPSTARDKDGQLTSRIMPLLPQGTPVTTLRNFVQYVVTEYGIANLWGKSRRNRCLELISIAHPDFRAELKKEAERLYWP
jgi:4-hydroxybutyrate CoA-transferase